MGCVARTEAASFGVLPWPAKYNKMHFILFSKIFSKMKDSNTLKLSNKVQYMGRKCSLIPKVPKQASEALPMPL